MSDWQDLLPAPTDPKEARFHRVAWAVAMALLRHGEEGIQVADLARRAGVSRAWIYKYFGHNIHEILDFSLRLFGPAFAAPATPEAASPAEWVVAMREGILKGLNDVRRVPWCVVVYFRYRQARGPFADALREVEERELLGFRERMPDALRRRRDAMAFVHAFHAARMGVFYHVLGSDPIDEDALVDSLMAMVHRFADQ